MIDFGLICSIGVGVALLVALCVFIYKCIKDKNWSKLLDLALDIIAEAEEKYNSGADKLDYATAMILKASEDIGFKISESDAKKLIESVIVVTKKVNCKSK